MATPIPSVKIEGPRLSKIRGMAGMEHHPELNTRAKAIARYQSMRRGHAETVAGLRRLKLPITQAAASVVAGEVPEIGPTPDSSTQERAALVLEALLFGRWDRNYRLNTPWRRLANEALSCLDFGAAFFETRWAWKEGSLGRWLLPSDLWLIPAETIESVDVGEDGTLIGVRQSHSLEFTRADGSRGFGFVNVLIEADRLLPVVHDQEGGDWQGNPVLRALHGAWERHGYLTRVRVVDHARRGAAPPLIELDEGWDPKTKAEAEELAQRLASGDSPERSYAVLTPGVRARFMDVDSRAPDLTKAIESEEDSFRAVFGSEFTTSEGGSLARASVQARYFDLTLLSIRDLLVEAFTIGVIEPSHALNWPSIPPSVLQLQGVIPRDLMALHSFLQTRSVVMTGDVLTLIHEALDLPAPPPDVVEQLNEKPILPGAPELQQLPGEKPQPAEAEPDAGAEGEAPVPTVPDDAAAPPKETLNGAQIDSLLRIVQEVAAGNLPKETAVNLITVSFPISEERARAILADVDEGEAPKPEAPPPPPPPSADEDAPEPEPEPAEEQDEGDAPEPIAQSMGGTPALAIFAESEGTLIGRPTWREANDHEKRFVNLRRLDREYQAHQTRFLQAVLPLKDQLLEKAILRLKVDGTRVLQPKPSLPRAKLRKVMDDLAQQIRETGSQEARAEVKRQLEAFQAGEPLTPAEAGSKAPPPKEAAAPWTPLLWRLGFRQQPVRQLAALGIDFVSDRVTGELATAIDLDVDRILRWISETAVDEMLAIILQPDFTGNEAAAKAEAILAAKERPAAFVRRIARNQASRGMNGGRVEGIAVAQTEIPPDVDLELVRRTEILDENTCSTCRDLDGRVFEVGTEAFWEFQPPRFCEGDTLCRGVYLPILQTSADARA